MLCVMCYVLCGMLKDGWCCEMSDAKIVFVGRLERTHV